MLWSAFLIGLLGSLHCVGMCGPIALMLPVSHDQPIRKSIQTLLYHLGRITAYALIGIFLGMIGESLATFGFQQHLSIAIGVILLITVIIPGSWLHQFSILQPVNRILMKLKSAMASNFKKKSLDSFFTLGFLNGFLPCGLVYVAAFAAIGTNGLTNSILYMILFGLGTVPLMSFVIFAKGFINKKMNINTKKLIPYAVAFVSILFILRGLGLGIPYVSPKHQPQEVNATQNCQPININP